MKANNIGFGDSPYLHITNKKSLPNGRLLKIQLELN